MSDVKRYVVLLPDEIDASMHRCKVILASDHEREVAALRAALKHLRDNALMGVDREYARTALNQSEGA